ncbi:MAG: hypothetical protein M0Q92_14045 [Methanoregula sp.]|jgi:uncharacterized protein YjbJ (UPF0337 family)|nr:hypothetical protein [Methanoregula sp.]
MHEVRLTIKKRVFPSEGRVRLNVANLSALEVHDGERVDLINESAKKTVTAMVIADTMVKEGQIRVSGEDLAALDLLDGSEVLVVRTTPLQEKVKKAAADVNASLTRSVDSLDKVARKTAGEVTAEAGKAAEGLRQEAKKASDSLGKTAGDVKKAVKDATRDDSL